MGSVDGFPVHAVIRYGSDVVRGTMPPTITAWTAEPSTLRKGVIFW